jgi:hypothetical protein
LRYNGLAARIRLWSLYNTVEHYRLALYKRSPLYPKMRVLPIHEHLDVLAARPAQA